MSAQDLYSGVNPFDNEQPVEAVQEELNAEREALSKLKPAYEEVMAVIASEKAAVSDLRSYLSQGIKAGEDIQAEYRARELYIGFLTRLGNSLTSRLKDADRRNQ